MLMVGTDPLEVDRLLGTFLADPTDVPELVVVHVAAQLSIANPGVFKGYAQRRPTQWGCR